MLVMCTRFALMIASVFCCAAIAFGQPAGGTTTAAKPKPAPKPSSSAKPPARPPSARTTPQTNSSPASIAGKWWTSGNDFGPSEVIFTQEGSRVAGEIHYADGATGTVTGTVNGKR